MSIVEAFSYEEDIREAGVEEGLQRGLERGLQSGLEKGVTGAIKLLEQIGLEASLVERKIMEQYNLSEEEADRYMKAVFCEQG